MTFDRQVDPPLGLAGNVAPGETKTCQRSLRERSQALQDAVRARRRHAALFLAQARSFARQARLRLGETIARREARDPTTWGQRLREIVLSGTCGSQASLLALRNPSLPFDLLSAKLQDVEESTAHLLSVWYNPSVPLLLLGEPSLEYHEAARDLLAQMTVESERCLLVGRPLRLEACVSAWASLPYEPVACWDEGRKKAYRQVRALARHLAGLFGLPWSDRP